MPDQCGVGVSVWAAPPHSGAADKVVVLARARWACRWAIRAVEAGFDVVGYDTDVERVKRLAVAKLGLTTEALARAVDVLDMEILWSREGHQGHAP